MTIKDPAVYSFKPKEDPEVTLFCAPQALCTSPSSLLTTDKRVYMCVCVCVCVSVHVYLCASRPAEKHSQGDPAPTAACVCVSVPLISRSLYLSPSDSHQHVSPSVQGQVVRSGEAAVTVCALKGLDPCVFPVMPRQLIRAGKLPRAAIPGAFVWLFPWREREQTQHMLNTLSLAVLHIQSYTANFQWDLHI